MIVIRLAQASHLGIEEESSTCELVVVYHMAVRSVAWVVVVVVIVALLQ